MSRIIAKVFCLLLFQLIIVRAAEAQSNNAISGPAEVCPEQTATYSVRSGLSFTDWILEGSYTLIGGSLTSPTIRVQWLTNGSIEASLNERPNGVVTMKTITLMPVSIVLTAPSTGFPGQTITLSATGASSYEWTGPGLTSTSGSSVTAVLPMASEYSFSVTGSNGTCSATKSTVIANSLPPLDAGPDRTYCKDFQTIDLQDWGLNLSEGAWTGPSGAITNNFINISLLPAGQYSFTYSRTADGSQDGILLMLIESVPGTLRITPAADCDVATGSIEVINYSGDIQFWEESIDNGNSWLKIKNAVGEDERNVTVNYAASKRKLFRAAVKKDNCALERTPPVEVIPLLAGFLSPSNISISCGRAFGTLVLDNASGVDFTWEKNTGTQWQTFSATTPFNFDVTENTSFRVKVEKPGCTSKYAPVYTINTTTIVGTISSNASNDICGVTSVILSLRNNIGDIKRWEHSVDNVNWNVLEGSSVMPDYSHNPNAPLNYYRTAVALGTCDEQYTTVYEIRISSPTVPGSVRFTREVGQAVIVNGKLTFYPEFTLDNSIGSIQNWWKKESETGPLISIPQSTLTLTPTVTTTTSFQAQVKNGGCDALLSGAAIFVINAPFVGVKDVFGHEVIGGGYDGHSYSVKSAEGVSIQGDFTFIANSGQGFFVLLDENYSLPPSDQNYVLAETVLKEGIDNEDNIHFLNARDRSSNYSYFDGIGRLIQHVNRKGSPTEKDIVTPVEYDHLGRQPRNYLPFVANASDGYFKKDATDHQKEFYLLPPDKVTATDYPYAVQKFEASPLNRVVEQGSAGTDWQPEIGNTIKTEYGINESGVIRLWNVDEISDLPKYIYDEPAAPQYYNAGELSIITRIDEHNSRTREFKDKDGLVVLKESQVGPEWLQTYYIYDDFNLLRFVIQPEGVLQMDDNPDSEFLEKWAFQYIYDERKRMIEKRVPGAEPVFMVYDSRDRLVLTQDGNQRARNEWMFNKYDELNRPVLTGIYTYVNQADPSRIIGYSEINDLVSKEAFAETFNLNEPLGYSTTNVFPSENLLVLTATYYDDYQFLNLLSSAYTYDKNILAGLPATEEKATTGLITGTQIRILESETWLAQVNYYDKRYRNIQIISDNHLGGKDYNSQLYDFAGKVITQSNVHSTISVSHTIAQEFLYDHASRVLAHYHKIDNRASLQLSQNNYNEIGQLIEKNLHHTDQGYVQSVDYRYNVRGWMTHINNGTLTNDGGITNDESSDLFGMELRYNSPSSEGIAQYNGNISQISWKKLGADKQSYLYQYDDINRLISANYFNLDNPLHVNRYSERITSYDRNGNIRKLERSGQQDLPGPLKISPFGPMDDLVYDYVGNQLQSVTDTETGTTDNEAGVRDKNKSGNDYRYDTNGNLTEDNNKEVDAIDYNYLNLPRIITKKTGETIVYTYDALGTKLSQVVSGPSKKTDYSGVYVTENDQLQFIQHAEGRITMTSEPDYQYFLKDHLGNIRLTFTSKKETTTSLATFELGEEPKEASEYLRYDKIRRVYSDLFDHTGKLESQIAIRLNGSADERYGLAKSLSVMPGDTIRTQVWAKYVDTENSNWESSLVAIMSKIAAASANPAVVIDGGNYSGNGAETFEYGGLLSREDDTGVGPKAYLNYLVFDRDFNLLEEKSGYKRLSNQPKENGNDVDHEELSSGDIIIEEAGFVYIYLSNENEATVDVFFDDLKVEHIESLIVQADDYYPFGLTFNSYQRENSTINNYLFNGKEKQDELYLGWLDYGARMYDPATGRWMAVDPLAEMSRRWSPYVYTYDNPIRFIDPDGMYSTEEWKKDNGITDDDVINIYSAEGEPDQDPPKRKLQSASDGYGKLLNRSYSATVTNSNRTADEMFDLIRSNFSSFVEGQSYFEKVSGNLSEPLSEGDEVAIVGGPGYGVSEATDEHKRIVPQYVDAEGNLHTGTVYTGVTVVDINKTIVNGAKSYSMSVQTWQGHVEAGIITFSVSQGSTGQLTMSINSVARSSNYLTDKAYNYLGGKEKQTEHWNTFLNNFIKSSGGIIIQKSIK